MEKKRFLTIFPQGRNIHMSKDVGMIPFYLQKDHNYVCTVATYYNSDDLGLSPIDFDLKRRYIKSIFKNSLVDGLLFVIFNGLKYDVVQAYHYDITSLIWLGVLKFLKGNAVITYLKLDANEKILSIQHSRFKGKIISFLLNKIDLISVESKYLSSELSSKWKKRVHHIPNGFHTTSFPLKKQLTKEKVFLTVGRIGAPEKGHKILLSAFANFAKLDADWVLWLVGPIDASFEPFLYNFIKKEGLEERIKIMGAIYETDKLELIYQRAGVFVLSSLWESFGLVLVEAINYGCFILSSSVVALPEIIDKGKYGLSFNIADEKGLLNGMKWCSVNWIDEIVPKQLVIKEHAYKNFHWSNIVIKVDQLISNK